MGGSGGGWVWGGWVWGWVGLGWVGLGVGGWVGVGGCGPAGGGWVWRLDFLSSYPPIPKTLNPDVVVFFGVGGWGGVGMEFSFQHEFELEF